MKTNLSNNVFAYDEDWFNMNPRIPSSTKDAGVSPGWTLEEINIVGLSKIKGLDSGWSPFSGKSPSIKASL